MTRIVMIGAGRMGRSIALVFAYGGFEVSILDLKKRSEAEQEMLFKMAKEEIKSNLVFLSEEGVFDKKLIPQILKRIQFHRLEEIRQPLENADIIFEGVPEIISAKREAFQKISPHIKKETIIASTTSTIHVDELALHVESPERFLNAHWLNPAFLIPLVEVSPGKFTSENVITKLFELLESVGKVPVRCKASPGYIIPRIQAIAMNEAARLVEEGVATVEDIDKAVKVGFGPRFTAMGMLEFIDWGGNDILYYASNYLKKTLDAERYTPPDIVVDHMNTGKNGMEKGAGFYNFDGMDVEKYRRETIGRLVRLAKRMGHLLPPKAE